MFRKFAPFVFVIALAVLAGSAVSGEYDFADPLDRPTGPNVIVDGNFVFYSKANGSYDESLTLNPITIQNGGTLTIGRSAGGTGTGFTLKLQEINFTDPDAVLNVLTANNGGNVTLNFGGLSLEGTGTGAGGGKVNFGDTTSTGTVTVKGAALAAYGSNGNSTITINQNANVGFTTISQSGMLGSTFKTDIKLAGGSLGIGTGALTMNKGEIEVSQSSILAAAGGVFIKGANAADAKLTIADGAELTVLANKDVPGVLGSLTIGGAGKAGTLDLRGTASKLTAGTLEFAEGAVFEAGATGQIAAEKLNVTANFTDTANVKTTVNGRTVVDDGVTYTVAGTNNVYSGGMTVKGTLQSLGGGTTRITFGTGINSTAELLVDGGSVAAGTGIFEIDYATINITKASAGLVTLDASQGALDLSESRIVVNSTSTAVPVTIDTTNDITAYSYTQLSGRAEVYGANQLVVTTPAVIGSASAGQHVTLDVSGNSVYFKGGLNLDKWGAVAATGKHAVNGTVDIGENASSAFITTTGNNRLHASPGNKLIFVDASGAGGRTTWNGTGNTVIGEVYSEEFDTTVSAGSQVEVATVLGTGGIPGDTVKGYEVGNLTIYGKMGLGVKTYPDPIAADAAGIVTANGNVVVKSGGLLHADYGTTAKYAYVANGQPGAGTTNILKVERGGTLLADTSTIYAKDFKSVEIQGTFIAGLLEANDPTIAARLVANSDINISSSALVTMTTDLAKTVTASADVNSATKLIEIDNSGGTSYTITNNANMSSKSMLGIFGFGLHDPNGLATILYVASARGQVSLDGSEADRLQAWENLKEIWGKNQVNYDLSNVIYDVVKGDVTANPPDSVAGNKNLALLGAIASPEGKVVGIDTLEYLNGAHLYGVTDVAMQTNRAFMSDIINRGKVVGCQFDQGAAFCADGAFGSSAMHDTLLNRFWIGGSGYVQDADSKDGFSGYKLKSYGFSGGYDRVLVPNVAGGFAFAYNKGDYEDKGAAAHDSEIENFSVGLYSTFTNPCGWFVTGHAAYTYAENDIRELRNDPDAERYSWARSKFRTGVWSLGALAGRDFRFPGCGLTVSPSVGLNFLHASNSDHTSYLDGVGTQRVTDAKNSAVYAPAEVTVQYDRPLSPCSKIRVEANAGYAYNFRSSGMTGEITYIDLDPSSSIGIHGRDNAKHSYKAGVGVRYQIKTFDAGLHYAYYGQDGYTGHRVTATAGISF